MARFSAVAISVALAGAWATPAASDDACGLCAKSIVVNSALANCFLERFPQLSARAANAVAINLEDCEAETERSVVPALRGPTVAHGAPSRKFFLSLPQLVCLKRKLEEPDIELDPSTQIDLGDC